MILGERVHTRFFLLLLTWVSLSQPNQPNLYSEQNPGGYEASRHAESWQLGIALTLQSKARGLLSARGSCGLFQPGKEHFLNLHHLRPS